MGQPCKARNAAAPGRNALWNRQFDRVAGYRLAVAACDRHSELQAIECCGDGACARRERLPSGGGRRPIIKEGASGGMNSISAAGAFARAAIPAIRIWRRGEYSKHSGLTHWRSHPESSTPCYAATIFRYIRLQDANSATRCAKSATESYCSGRCTSRALKPVFSGVILPCLQIPFLHLLRLLPFLSKFLSAIRAAGAE